MTLLRSTTRRLPVLILAVLFAASAAVRAAPGESAPRFSPAAAPDTISLGENIDLIQSLGGQVDDMHKSGGRLYLLTGRDLITVDVSNPAAPSVLGRATLPVLPGEVAFAGDYLYFHPNANVSVAEQPMFIMNVSDPLRPRLVGTYVDRTSSIRNNPWVVDLVTDGHFVYRLVTEQVPQVGNGYWMDIIDVSDPARPAQINVLRFPMIYTLRTMALANGRIVIGYDSGADTFYGTGTNGALIVDVAAPAADLGAKVWDISVDISVVAKLVSIHADASRLTLIFRDASIPPEAVAFYVFDIRDPAHATRIGSIVGGDADPLTTMMFGVDGTRGLFAAEGAQFGLKVTDLANPAAPVPLGSLTFGPAAHVRSLWQDGRAYMLGQGANGETVLHIIDIQNPAVPLERGRLIVSPFQEVTSVVEQDGVAYILVPSDYSLRPQGNRGVLLAYDVSDPARPAELSRLVLPFVPDDVAIEGGYLYVGGQYQNPFNNPAVSVIDVRDPAAPALVSRYSSSFELATFYVLGVKDRRVYLNDNVHDVKVIDFSNLAAPQVVATIEASPLEMAFSGSIAWFLEGNPNPPNELLLVGRDMANPAAPRQVGSLSLDASFGFDQMAIEGRYAYIWSRNNLLRVIDIAAPAAPRVVSTYQMDHVPPPGFGAVYARSLVLDDGYLYARTNVDLRVVDVSRPLQPSVVASAAGSVDGYAVHARAGIIFLPNENGLTVLRNRAGSVAGTVRQANRQPFAGAGLQLSTGLTATSDLAGGYRFQDLPRATVSVTPTLAGYAFWPPHRSASLPPNGSADFVVTAAPATAALSPSAPTRLVIADTQGLPTTFDFAASPAASATVTPTPPLHQPPFGATFAGHAFQLAPDTLSATVTVAFSPADVRVVSDLARLALWRWDGQKWQAADCAGAPLVDPAAGTLSTGLCAGGEYALLGPTHQLAMTWIPVR
ncbi:MAG TPA: hypothetical protein VD886_02985 [Herpetosiphonaceae bacterium]|nr:hypothetical protein [Herpetosiphonaceae bacterium]